MTRSSGLMRETEGRTEENKGAGLGLAVFAISPSQRLKPCDISLIHYPVQYIRGQYCTLPAKSTLILSGEDLQCWIFVLCVNTNPVMRWDRNQSSPKTDWDSICCHSLSSLAILQAIFLKAMDVPDILLKRTPLSERRGSLHTSISHWTRLSWRASPWTQKSRKRSRCS